MFVATMPEEPDSPKELVVGYIIYGIHGNESRVISIAISNRCRGKGNGRILMQSAMVESYQQRATFMTLHVNVENLVAQKLYKSLGFTASKWIEDYYGDEDCDGLLLQANLKELVRFSSYDSYSS